jgi:alkylation response protein AidB-like acyl-CoA dehydrogenase
VGRYQRDGGQPLDELRRDELMQRYVDSRVLGILGEVSLAEAIRGGAPGPAQSVMKLFWGLLSQQVADTKVTLAGLDGVFGPDISGEGPARTFLTSRSTTIAGGTTEVMKNILAERVLGLPKDGA